MTFAFDRRGVLVRDLRETLALALPLIGGQLALFSQHLVDVMLAGHLGARVLGVVAIGTNTWSVAVMAIVGMMMALPPGVAQLDGAGRRGDVVGLFRQAVWLALGLGLVMQQVTWWGAPVVLARLGMDDGLLAETVAFTRVLSLAAPAVALFCACRGLTDGVSRPGVSLGFGILGLAVLAPLGWALMYGRLGAPAMGAMGCAVANLIAMWVSALAYLGFARFSRTTRDLGWALGAIGPRRAAIMGLLRVGAPMSVSVVLEAAVFATASLVVASFGEVAAGSHQIALNVAALSFMVPLGLSMAVTVRVGNAVGRGDAAGMRRAGMVGIAAALVTQSVPAGLMLLVPVQIVALYTGDPALVAGAAGLLTLAALFQLSDGVQVAAMGALRGLKDTRVPMLIAAFSYWGIGMPTGWLLTFAGGMGIGGMWMGLIAGLSTAAVLLALRFHLRTRRRVAGLVMVG
ncbi:MAG: MATE family efflux transporter [Acetobacteraceae bacterium]|nr:MATE family efflux transporter [Acetobacteraceae bacterium]